MVAKIIEVGKFYYYGKVQRRMKCTAIGTSKDRTQSDFVDYLGNRYRFYNHDMHEDRYK